jgi:hypothetical protein
MEQNIFNQQTFPLPYILTIPWELISTMPFEDKGLKWKFAVSSSELSLAMTSPHAYMLFEMHHQKRTTAILCDPHRRFPYYLKCIKALQLQNRWPRVKFIPILGSQNSHYAAKVVCSCGAYKMRTEIDHTCINDLMMGDSPGKKILFKLNDPFEKFEKLKTFTLFGAQFNSEDVEKLSKLPLLESIYLKNCKMSRDHLSRIFEFTALKALQLSHCEFAGIMEFIKPPSQLEMFGLKHCKVSQDFVLNTKDCTLLIRLIVRSGPFNSINFIPPEVAPEVALEVVPEVVLEDPCLRNLELDCNLVNPKCFENLVTNLDVLVLPWHAIYIYKTFASEAQNPVETKHRQLDFSLNGCPKELHIKHPRPMFTLSCILPIGSGTFIVVLMWGKRHPKKTLTFFLDPNVSTTVTMSLKCYEDKS